MIGKAKREIFVLLLLVYYSKAQTTSCGISLKAVKGSVLILSDDLVDANTAQEKCSLLGGNLVMTDEPQINKTLTQLLTEKYTAGLRRVYIFYHHVDGNRYKYSFNSTEDSNWSLARHLGHLWYFDLYTRNGGNSTDTITFCDAPAWTRKKWGVFVNDNCSIDSNGISSGWKMQITLYSKNYLQTDQKKIYHYFGGLGSSKLRNVNESYGVFTNYQGSFQSPDINVTVGARYNTSLHGWYWSDGSPANFPVSNVTTCQQGALHYGIGWEQSSMKCSGEPAHYACQMKLQASAKKFHCNASTVIVSWTGLDQFIIEYKLTAKVEIHVLELNQRRYASYPDLLTAVGNLNSLTNYNIQLTAMISGCQTLNVTSSLTVTTFGNPPPSCYPPDPAIGHSVNPVIIGGLVGGMLFFVAVTVVLAVLLFKRSKGSSVESEELREQPLRREVAGSSVDPKPDEHEYVNCRDCVSTNPNHAYEVMT